MKKLLLFIIAVACYSTVTMAQCTPDLTITTPGIYPDTVTNLPQGYTGVFYDTDIQFKVITDTNAFGINIDVVDITVDAVNGLPLTMSYECSPPNCTFLGGSNGCIRLSGTSAVSGTFNLDVDVTLHGLLFGFIPFSQPATITGYRIDFIPPPPAPVAVFSASQTTVCESDVVTFTDLSSNTPDAWLWSFPGGTPSTSADQNPVVQYSTPGVYDVTLTVSNPGGSDDITVSGFITVNAKPIAKISPHNTVTFCVGSSEVLTANSGPGYTYQWFKYGNLLSGQTNQTLNVTTAGNYKVKVTDPATGCTKRSGLRTVIVETPPAVAISANGPTTFCKDLSVDLVATSAPGNSIQWTKGGIDIPGATSSVYEVTSIGFYKARATSPLGCEKTSQGMTVTVLPSPNAGVTASGPLQICQGDDVTLSAIPDPSYSYQWELDLVAIPGAINPDYIASIAGKYTVLIESTNGCFRRSGVKKVQIVCREGIGVSSAQSPSVDVVPNPTAGLANVELTIPQDTQVKIDIYDVTGKQQLSVANEQMQAGSYSMQIDLDTYPRGLYFVRVVTGDKVTTARLVLQ